MTATKFRPEAAPRWTAIGASFVVHAGLFAGLAAIPAGLVAAAPRAPAEPDRPLAVTWVRTAPETEAVVVRETSRTAASPIPEPRPEIVEIPDLPAADLPAADLPAVDDAVPREPAAPTSALSWSRMRELASLRPGHGAGRGESLGASASGGGTGGGTGSGGGTPSGTTAGAGTGDGDDGAGSGWAARGGVTRGPAIVGPLPPPVYPASARRRGWEGRVVLALAIDERGRVTGADVAESSGRPALDEAARDAAAAWTFSAALRDGEPVAGTLRVPVRFELTD